MASGLTSPIRVVPSPDATGRLFIVDQTGVVWTLASDGSVLSHPFMDIRDRVTPLRPGYDERGLLSIAFHPQFATNGRVFAYYTAPLRPGAPAGYDHTGRISEFQVFPAGPGDPPVVNRATERVLLEWDHPQFNHNGGSIIFGPDGMLYISIGDGGNANDVGLGHVEDWYPDNPGGNGQDVVSNLLGNILRIDVDRGTPYAIPPDNPFAGPASPALDEIWAYGFRNPYFCSFDMGGSHALLCQDAGQELWEEVSVVERGGNYGWNVLEGTHCFNAFHPLTVRPSCPGTGPHGESQPLIDPVIEFPNTKNPFVPGLGLTVVGGFVYRGQLAPEFTGRYIFASATDPAVDNSGRLFVSTPTAGAIWPMQELLIGGTTRINHVIKGFGQDLRGEVYVAGSQVLGPTGTTGKVWRIVRAEAP